MTTNLQASSLVEAVINVQGVITVPCLNGDVITASDCKILRWGKSRFAEPSGKIIHDGHAAPGTIGLLVVENCGRGNAAKAAKKYL